MEANMSDYAAAKTLGWASIALGLTEFVAPRWVQDQLGVSGHDKLLRGLGLREMAAGVGLLSQDNPTGLAAGLWSRVAGDAMDVALLAAAAARTRRPGGLATMTAMVLGITAADIVYALRWHKHAGLGKPSLANVAQQAKQFAGEAGGRVREVIGSH
jgi:hypothetical protein